MKTGIIIVTYNIPSSVLLLQIECIRKYCQDEEYEINIIDNSNIPEIADAIHFHCYNQQIKHYKTYSDSAWGSSSHAFAANFSYHILGDRYNRLIYFDHDLFPIKPFTADGVLEGHILAGIGQQKSKTYLWPGCLFIDDTHTRNMVDFSVDHELGLDTGGNLYKIIERYGKDNVKFFDEKYCENPYFTIPPYNYYALINDGMFLHFVNASNWNNVNGNEERLSSLINIVRNKIDG